ncbi:ATP-dependent DNA helicase [Candidatus Mycobacterium wuenschmannii]|uniref:DNA 3'-5' helicase n=1 Tax=Candidatus Mycobacterium wuenschmannii TaxID=3027808 RepID=A0ABY8W097_9MYCO|nr:ATP-dependent DNA helicase [Candidatus Mycobacterium wuenschmannii]WIM87877.1 ATP-dependent DNA helicase [Candidatus Mycobacterium wuenschmannii]
MSFHWGPEARAALDPDLRGTLRVLGGPGTGKSSLLIDAAATRIGAGADPESVLLLTGSGRISAQARSALTARLLSAQAAVAGPAVVREPLVRSVHSYAFAVLRLAAQRAGGPPPRLVTSAEQDAIIAELLAGEIADGPDGWPAELRAALGTDGFAAELRELLTRCAERGVDPQQLERVGRLSGRPEWTAAGRFARSYEQVMLLRAAVGTAAPQATTPAVGAAELVGAALEAFAVDAELLAAERARIGVLLVDDAQQLDPQAALLVRVLAAGADVTLLAGDPDQAVFGFRGAEPAALLGDGTPSVTLATSHRCAPAVARAVSGVAARLSGGGHIDGVGDDPGSVLVQSAVSTAAESALIADYLRRAHLVDGVPWSQMAVVVRSVPRAAAGLSHALERAGVPVAPAALTGPLIAQPAAQALLAVLTATADGLSGEQAVALLTGPIGRVDPVSLRQLRRTLRRGETAGAAQEFGDLLVAALAGASSARLSAAQARPVQRVRAVLEAAAESHRRGEDPRYTLWAAWQRSGLQRRWLTASERGGTAGVQAGRDLDTVTALFDATDKYLARTAGASLRGLLDHLITEQLRAVGTETAAAEQVAVLSAHAAIGHEWDLVVVAGLQEGLWPNTIPRGGVLGTQRLLDVLDGVTENASMRAPLLAEERRLLVAALGRARTRLLVTAVDGEAGGGDEDSMPSPFFAEIAQWSTGDADAALQPVVGPRVLSTNAVVGRLRGVVCAPQGSVTDEMRDCAATQLARLADAGVPGADPAGWYGMAAVSTTAPMWSRDEQPEHVVTLTPSSLQTLTDCPLRWMAERHGGTDPRDLGSTVGSIVHALIAEPGGGEPELLAALERAWRHLPFESRWYADNELARHRTMIETFLEWRTQTRSELTEVGVEVEVDGGLDGGHVRLRGRVDRIERDAAGRLVIVDVKTGKTPVTKDDAQRHAQLAAYQLAVAEGLVDHGDEPGGGRLVYLGKPGSGGATEREQDPLTPEAREQWRDTIRRAADATAGPQFLARVNDGCSHCPLRASCPAQTGLDGQGAV